MNPGRKLRVAMYWASSCGGCDISLLEIGSNLLDLAGLADIVFWPCALDFKYADVARYPDRHIDICFFNGGIRSSEHEQVARLLRAKSVTLVGYGTCAADGGIPALANLTSKQSLYQTVFRDGPTLDNPAGVEPREHTQTAAGTLELPRFYPAVLRLRDVVAVDYEIPGCPPQADDVWESVEAMASGAMPAHNSDTKIGCSNRTVCDECDREKRLTKIAAFRRHHQFRPEPGWCLLEQGLLCLGSATRGGCGALCPRVAMRCEGCYGPPAGSGDQGASMIGALGGLVDASTEDHAREMVNGIVDPTGTFYRFSMASSAMKLKRAQEGPDGQTHHD